jgi:hypothetical protein
MDTNFSDADYADYAGNFAVEKGAILGVVFGLDGNAAIGYKAVRISYEHN